MINKCKQQKIMINKCKQQQLTDIVTPKQCCVMVTMTSALVPNTLMVMVLDSVKWSFTISPSSGEETARCTW